jgi:lipopolysaccharide transport system ATP-binding protein
MKPIIKVEHVGKQYRIGARQETYDTLRDSIAGAVRAPFKLFRGGDQSANNTIWALDDVSFEVNPGEVLGIIGRNGAGKSTLLKILSRITDPTTGQVELYGRVGCLLEVGTGFHPELTGRENIFLNGSMLGLNRRDIERKFDQIVDFAGVDKFIDTPVKRYSSGMYVRLAFAVAAHLEPEILIVDEVLAVGDASFQKKCLGKMGDVAHEGRTVLFVSHNMAAIQSLCKRALLLNGGHLVADGGCKRIVDEYLQVVDQVSDLSLGERSDRKGNQNLRFIGFELRDSQGACVPCGCSGQDMLISLEYESTTRAALQNVHVALGVHGRFDENLFHLSTGVKGFDFESVPAKGRIICRIPRLPLQAGRYTFNLFCTVGGEVADWIENAGLIEVEEGDFFGSGKLPPAGQGAFIVQHSWSVS